MNNKQITITLEEYELLTSIANEVNSLPFGSSIALPWCRESFVDLHKLMNIYEEWLISNIKESL